MKRRKGQTAASSAPAAPAAIVSTAGPRLEWRVHPAAENPSKAFGVAVAVVAIGALFGLAFEGLFWFVLAEVFLFASLSSYFFASTYAVGAGSIAVSGPATRREVALSRFRRVTADRNGVQLSTFSEPSRLDPYRGLYLLLPRDERRTAILDRLRREIHGGPALG